MFAKTANSVNTSLGVHDPIISFRSATPLILTRHKKSTDTNLLNEQHKRAFFLHTLRTISMRMIDKNMTTKEFMNQATQ